MSTSRVPPWACFVTGTDTEIGKTLVSCALLCWAQQQGWRALGLKPLAAGATQIDGQWHNEDVDALAACSNVVWPQAQRTPYLLRTPAAPHLAAALEGLDLELASLLAPVTHARTVADAVVVEGVGGFRVPLNAQHDTADWAQTLALPVVLVVGLRLGCINHALLTAEAIRARGLTLAGWVANQGTVPMAHVSGNMAALTQRLPAPLLGVIPPLQAANAAARAQEALAYLDSARLHAQLAQGEARSGA